MFKTVTGLSGLYFRTRLSRTLQRIRIGGPRYLIVNGDDFGMTPGISRGILEAYEKGILTTTSAMMNMPSAVDDLIAARKRFPDFPIGLHLNITTGSPVLPPDQIPTLVDREGRFHGLIHIVRSLNLISPDEVWKEISAQAQRMSDCGVKFDHLDYHHHALASHHHLYKLVIQLAEQFNVPVRQPVPETLYGYAKKLKGIRSPRVVSTPLIRSFYEAPQEWLDMLPHITPEAYRERAEQLRQHKIQTTNWLIETFFKRATFENFVSMIEQLPPGISELVTHPGYVDEPLRNLDTDYIEGREAELKILTDPLVKAVLDKYNVVLVDFSMLRTAKK